MVGISCLAAAILLMTGSAAASHDPSGEPFDEDFVAGRAQIGAFLGGVTAVVDAHSGPSGESPSGSVSFSARANAVIGPVTCLRVSGNRAVIGGQSTTNIGPGYLFEVEDNTATGAPDAMGLSVLAEVPTTCPEDLEIPLTAASSGDLVVHDAAGPSLPTSKDQCKRGGWREFGFKNQGQCIKFVQNGG